MAYRDPLATETVERLIYVASPYGRVYESYVHPCTARAATMRANRLGKRFAAKHPETKEYTVGWRMMKPNLLRKGADGSVHI